MNGETEKKLRCWEFMQCGREKGGNNVDHLGVCPAYPLHGHVCANVVGTFCDLVQVLHRSEHAECEECPYFNSMHFNEKARRTKQEKRV
jgi:hypothetical protein